MSYFSPISSRDLPDLQSMIKKNLFHDLDT
jgi:hypothetical protein